MTERRIGDISIVIPAYNGACFIGEAIDSIWRQSVLPREIIVVDDASSDHTVELVRALAPQSPVEVRIIELQKNSGGPATPMNVGIAAANSRWIAVLDQDDVFMPQKLEQQIQAGEANPQAKVIVSLAGRYDSPERQVPYTHVTTHLTRMFGSNDDECYLIPSKWALAFLVAYENFSTGYPGIIFKKCDWSAHGPIDETFVIAGDIDWVCNLCSHGAMAWIPQIQYLRREHSANLCRRQGLVEAELWRVRSRYLRNAISTIRTESSLAEACEQDMRRAAWKLRCAGLYSEAIRCGSAIGSCFGWRKRNTLSLAKTLGTWAVSGCAS